MPDHLCVVPITVTIQNVLGTRSERYLGAAVCSYDKAHQVRAAVSQFTINAMRDNRDWTRGDIMDYLHECGWCIIPAVHPAAIDHNMGVLYDSR